jgi:osmoprotectant transport system substrate-binding protein
LLKKKYVLISMTIVATLLLAACGGAATTQAPAAAPTQPAATQAQATQPSASQSKGLIVVGSKNFTEQFILGQITVQALRNAGYQVDDNTNTGGTAVAREALVNGDIDMYWEYTGTAWLTHLGHENAITNSQEAYQKVKAEDAKNGLVWLDMAPFNNTYTLMMQKDTAAKEGIQSISDLANYINGGGDASLCTDQEFYARPDGFKGVEQLYGFKFTENQVNLMDAGLTYKALKDGQCSTAMGFATDGRIAAFGFINLKDDKNFFPVYNPAPVVRKDIMDKYPDIADILNPIAAKLTTDTMTNLNKEVDVDGKEPVQAACDFLTTNGFVQNCPQQ